MAKQGKPSEITSTIISKAMVQLNGAVTRMEKRALIHGKYIQDVGNVLTKLKGIVSEAETLCVAIHAGGKLHEGAIQMQQVAAMNRAKKKTAETPKSNGGAAQVAAAGAKPAGADKGKEAGQGAKA